VHFFIYLNYLIEIRMILAMGTNFGYIRVSTNEQNLDRQLEAIKPYVTNEKYSIEGEIFAGVYFT
jgi:hypothetical protein